MSRSIFNLLFVFIKIIVDIGIALCIMGQPFKKGGCNMDNILEGFSTVQKVRALMAANNMNMQSLADYLKVSIGTVSNRFEKNDWTVPELKLLAEKFGTTLTDLI